MENQTYPKNYNFSIAGTKEELENLLDLCNRSDAKLGDIPAQLMDQLFTLTED